MSARLCKRQKAQLVEDDEVEAGEVVRKMPNPVSRNPGTNLVREPLREPVSEEEDAQAREAVCDRF